MYALYNNHYSPKDLLKALGTLILIIIAVTLVSCLFTGCVTEKGFNKAMKKHPDWVPSKDSVSVVTKTVRHDSLIKIKGDNIYKDSLITIPCPQSQIKAVISHNTGAQAKITTVHDTIHLKCTCDSLQAVVTLLSKQVETYKHDTTIVAKEKPWNWFENLMYYSGIIAWVIVLIKYGGPLVMQLIKKIPDLPF